MASDVRNGDHGENRHIVMWRVCWKQGRTVLRRRWEGVEVWVEWCCFSCVFSFFPGAISRPSPASLLFLCTFTPFSQLTTCLGISVQASRHDRVDRVGRQ